MILPYKSTHSVYGLIGPGSDGILRNGGISISHGLKTTTHYTLRGLCAVSIPDPRIAPQEPAHAPTRDQILHAPNRGLLLPAYRLRLLRHCGGGLVWGVGGDHATSIINLCATHFLVDVDAQCVHIVVIGTARYRRLADQGRRREMIQARTIKPGTYGRYTVGRCKLTTGEVGYSLSFPFDQRESARVRKILDARWLPGSKVWFVPAASNDMMTKYLAMEG